MKRIDQAIGLFTVLGINVQLVRSHYSILHTRILEQFALFVTLSCSASSELFSASSCVLHCDPVRFVLTKNRSRNNLGIDTNVFVWVQKNRPLGIHLEHAAANASQK